MSNDTEDGAGLRVLHGRQLNALSKEYMLPADAPEMQRLNTQHRMLLLALGGLYPDGYADDIRRRLEPRSGETIEIADLGSGSGDWISDMAKEFPHIQAVGMDLAPSAPNDVAPNVRFERRDVTKNLEDYKESFDMVQARAIANGVVDYPAFIDLATQTLKPGGILMLAEGYLQIYDEELNVMNRPSGISRLFAEVSARQPSPGRVPISSLGDRIEGWVQEHAGYEDVRTQAVYTPFGWGGSTDLCKEPVAAGRLMMQNIQTFVGAWSPMFLSAGVPEAEVNAWVSEARRELEEPDTLKAYAKWIVVCGKKVV